VGHEKSKVVEGGKIKGLIMVTGFTNSQKLTWMNNLIMALDSEYDPVAQTFKATGYEWK
jgi:Tfp pilus assembly pilus retraction ATPase PilT